MRGRMSSLLLVPPRVMHPNPFRQGSINLHLFIELLPAQHIFDYFKQAIALWKIIINKVDQKVGISNVGDDFS